MFICVMSDSSASVCGTPTSVVAQSVQPRSVTVEYTQMHTHTNTQPQVSPACLGASRQGVPAKTKEERVEMHCFVSLIV